MLSLSSVLTLAHLLGFALGLGGATVKLFLLLQSVADHRLVPSYIRIAGLITRLIVAGLILLIVSGLATIVLVGTRPFTALFMTKLLAVAALLVIGAYIDNVAEPRVGLLAPIGHETPSAEFRSAQRFCLTLEIAATALFYLVAIIWVLF